MTMMLNFKTVKPALLALVIGIGLIAECTKAQAGETETAVVAGGCFWCVEHDFEKVRGVAEAVSGFSGGTVANPTYRQVTRGGTGHLEAVQITYDPDVISYEQILTLFLRSIDPFDAGGQFCDRGESYAPAIFADGDDQTRTARQVIAAAEAELGRSIKVPVRAAVPFYPAEAYHQDYASQTRVILTRFGPQSKAEAYRKYRAACGRDQRVRAVWGEAAPFVGG